ncbi:TolC family protein [Aestuariibaculum sp. YM273]|uniref:TolC family protein n=1 Tax=Aestuariibaculum sp. YM273 TaxID=3070659 RepID=UPI0027DBF1ED|nr:TolC family protein [Aestuariibaculum sp. YM273]WMI66904.1 TolC family protein [Aestuariibaculum sp. YM273]
MKQHLILLFSLLLSISLFAQEQSYAFSLEEAINFAIENNRTAINAAKDIEAAEKQKWETTATGLPQLNASVDYQNFLKQQVSLIPAEAFGGNPGEFEEVVFGTKQNMTATATITQKIFDGSYIVGLQSAKVYLDISKNAKQKTDLEIRKAVINAYGNVLLAEESLTLLNKDRKILEDNVNDTSKMFENGLEEEESVEQLQITLSGLMSNLNKTERLKVLAYQMLNITLGLDINANTTLTDKLEMLTAQNISLELLSTDENIENNIDYKIAENSKVSQELLLKLEKSKAMPTLNAFLNGGYSGFSNSFNFLSKDQEWFGTSLFGVSLNIPIFSSLGRTAATARVKIDLEKAENDLKETEQQLKLQIASAKSEYQFAIEDYENKKLNLNLAERIESKNQTKFFEGIGSSFDLRQAQTQLYNAQQEFLQAMLDVINTKAELETILNTVQIN